MGAGAHADAACAGASRRDSARGSRIQPWGDREDHGDGIFATFDDPLDGLYATLSIQRMLADPAATSGIPLRIRCALHVGVVERRDADYFGTAVNQTARIMGAAHGGQVLVSQSAADLLADRLPAGLALRDLGSIRLRDLATPARVFQLLQPDLRQDFPALRSLEATPNNLPQQMTSFVGRERELAEARALLGGARLVTIVGPGALARPDCHCRSRPTSSMPIRTASGSSSSHRLSIPGWCRKPSRRSWACRRTPAHPSFKPCARTSPRVDCSWSSTTANIWWSPAQTSWLHCCEPRRMFACWRAAARRSTCRASRPIRCRLWRCLIRGRPPWMPRAPTLASFSSKELGCDSPRSH